MGDQRDNDDGAATAQQHPNTPAPGILQVIPAPAVAALDVARAAPVPIARPPLRAHQNGGATGGHRGLAAAAQSVQKVAVPVAQAAQNCHAGSVRMRCAERRRHLMRLVQKWVCAAADQKTIY